jgi:hypothetical protein
VKPKEVKSDFEKLINKKSLSKNTQTWKHSFYKPISLYLYTYMHIMCIYIYMNTYQPFAAASQLPAALFVSEISWPWICWTRILSMLSIFIDLSLPLFFFKQLAIWSNDYASKTRIEILCKRTCSIARDVFPKSGFSNNSGILWTLVWTSTWMTKVHKIPELFEKPDFGKTSRAIEHVLLHRISMRVLLA